MQFRKISINSSIRVAVLSLLCFCHTAIAQADVKSITEIGNSQTERAQVLEKFSCNYNSFYLGLSRPSFTGLSGKINIFAPTTTRPSNVPFADNVTGQLVVEVSNDSLFIGDNTTMDPGYRFLQEQDSASSNQESVSSVGVGSFNCAFSSCHTFRRDNVDRLEISPKEINMQRKIQASGGLRDTHPVSAGKNMNVVRLTKSEVGTDYDLVTYVRQGSAEVIGHTDYYTFYKCSKLQGN